MEVNVQALADRAFDLFNNRTISVKPIVPGARMLSATQVHAIHRLSFEDLGRDMDTLIKGMIANLVEAIPSSVEFQELALPWGTIATARSGPIRIVICEVEALPGEVGEYKEFYRVSTDELVKCAVVPIIRLDIAFREYTNTIGQQEDERAGLTPLKTNRVKYPNTGSFSPTYSDWKLVR